MIRAWWQERRKKHEREEGELADVIWMRFDAEERPKMEEYLKQVVRDKGSMSGNIKKAEQEAHERCMSTIEMRWLREYVSSLLRRRKLTSTDIERIRKRLRYEESTLLFNEEVKRQAVGDSVICPDMPTHFERLMRRLKDKRGVVLMLIIAAVLGWLGGIGNVLAWLRQIVASIWG